MKIDKKIRTSPYPSKLQFVNPREASMELLMQSQEMLFARDICKLVGFFWRLFGLTSITRSQ